MRKHWSFWVTFAMTYVFAPLVAIARSRLDTKTTTDSGNAGSERVGLISLGCPKALVDSDPYSPNFASRGPTFRRNMKTWAL